MPGETTAIFVRDLVVGFGSRVVIDHLSLEVRAGEIIGLVGASGGGKSVLLRTLIGLLPKRSGTIDFPGEAAGAAVRRGVRWLPTAAAACCSSRARCSRP
jgi:phospholipid/cholesterol/gamma-HCH transport system ATP-binding protein